jgi:pilus assembly protein Flp/PilA
MMQLVKRLWNEDSGQGMVEYGLIIALVAVALVGALVFFREQIAGIFNGITGAINPQ